MIVSKIEELARAAMKLGEAAYGSQAGAGEDAQSSAGDATGGAGSNDGVVDAEFEEVRDDDNKKKSA